LVLSKHQVDDMGSKGGLLLKGMTPRVWMMESKVLEGKMRRMTVRECVEQRTRSNGR